MGVLIVKWWVFFRKVSVMLRLDWLVGGLIVKWWVFFRKVSVMLRLCYKKLWAEQDKWSACREVGYFPRNFFKPLMTSGQ